MKQTFLIAFFIVVSSGAYGLGDQDRRGQKPNILIIVSDDCSYNDLPLYGGRNIKTPNIDRLAGQGMTFDNAFVSMSMCLPSRSSLYTGLYPVSNGACWNHSASKPGVRSITHFLGGLGYKVGIAGKIHVKPESVYPFEMVGGLERKAALESAAFDASGMNEFIERAGKNPFCLVVGLVSPHSPWTEGDASRFSTGDLVLPEYLADTKTTRMDFANYLAEIELMDQQVGQTLGLLEKYGITQNTLVIFTSEQGAQFPGSKWTLWNQGIHTGFICRWPGQIKGNTRSDALIQWEDVLPTLIDLAGGSIEAGSFDGSSFAAVLTGSSGSHRSYAYHIHNNVPEGPPYPIRGITDGTWHYIRNLQPDRIYIEKHVMGMTRWQSTWASWVVESTRDTDIYSLVRRYQQRPPEELYNLDKDPYEMENLAGMKEHEKVLMRLSNELDRWMEEEDDPGAVIDSWEYLNAARKGKHITK